MSRLPRESHSIPIGVVLALSAATLLGACVTQVRVADPPPPESYVEPVAQPPPAYEGPAEDMQVAEAPPPLPDYEQPPCPAEGYLWTPGYWAYGGGDYYWVPGTWVQPPRVGVLWTPGYWGFVGGMYVFHAGYWGPHIGYYGGVHYGYGYTGNGFAGGRWVGNSFAYNRSVTNVNVTVVHNSYNETVINNNVRGNRVSYNGGVGGIATAPTPQERVVAREPHIPPTAPQRQHTQQAAENPDLFARANGGRPAIAATPRAAAFSEPGVIGAHGAGSPHPMPPGAHANSPPNANPGANGNAYGRANPPANANPGTNGNAYGRANPPANANPGTNGNAYGRANPPANPNPGANGNPFVHANPPANPNPGANGNPFVHANPPANPNPGANGNAYGRANPPANPNPGANGNAYGRANPPANSNHPPLNAGQPYVRPPHGQQVNGNPVAPPAPKTSTQQPKTSPGGKQHDPQGVER